MPLFTLTPELCYNSIAPVQEPNTTMNYKVPNLNGTVPLITKETYYTSTQTVKLSYLSCTKTKTETQTSPITKLILTKLVFLYLALSIHAELERFTTISKSLSPIVQVKTPVIPKPKVKWLDDKLCRIIQAASYAYQVEPALIASIIQVESQGYQKAIGPKVITAFYDHKRKRIVKRETRALGFMQIMPFNYPYLKPEHLLTEANIFLGTRLFKEYLTKANGNLDKALSFYNAGPYSKQITVSYNSSVKRWYSILQNEPCLSKL